MQRWRWSPSPPPSSIIIIFDLPHSNIVIITLPNLILKLLSEEVGEEIRGPWLARRRTLYHAKAQALFEAGQVEAAAELGLAAAQGLYAN